MTSRWTRSAAAALALALAACSAAPTLAPPALPLPDLRGTWTGTWGGAPLTLIVLEQGEPASDSGVYLGPWLLFGRDLPGVTGVLTFTARGEATSINVRGRLGASNGAPTLVLEPLTPHGGWIALRVVDDRRLVGTGTSRAAWEPRGPVELTRDTPPR